MSILSKNGQCNSAMVVEDDEFSFESLRVKLQRMKFANITWAINGQMAVKLMDALEVLPDLIVCDIFMPEMDGIEFSEQLHQRKYKGALIFMSGGDTTILHIAEKLAIASQLRLLGAFSKPISMDTLEAALAFNVE